MTTPMLDEVRPDAVAVETLSGALAAFGVELELDRVAAPVIAHAKLLLLDTLGAALAGVDTAEGRAAIAAAREFGGEAGPATVWGTAGRTTRAAAALVNGVRRRRTWRWRVNMTGVAGRCVT